MIPKLDLDIGIFVYSTKFKGIGGKIKSTPEDFLVSEILDEKTLSKVSTTEGYPVYKLKKHGIDTNHALSEILKIHGLRLKALGLKDANATTEQFVCSMETSRNVRNFSTNRYTLEFFGYLPKPLTKRDMVGNHFKIKIEDAPFLEINNFNEYDKVLNFFGYQRFGSKRPVSHLIGKAILQNNFDLAVNLLLSFSSENDSPENTKIRKMLEDKSNYPNVLQEIPPQMDIERIVLSEMVEHGNPLRALRTIPLTIRRFFVQAFQSFVFNCTVSSAFEYGEELFAPKSGDVCYDKKSTLGRYENDQSQRLAIPLVGYSYSKKNRFDYHISKVLENEQVHAKDFFSKTMQEASDEGGFRQAVMKCENFSLLEPTITFTLSRGSYATILLREIMKPKDPIKAGF
ncbi:MAG TPA: tRNA pseudouridine(13) synthase TruD [Nitrosopumilaceae archaeon]|nr:tRNA pseudouridine(13) synthase TruD [Nitrosopumilaceae archaeon]